MSVGKFVGDQWRSEYRVLEIAGMYSPQQGYIVRGRERWFSLLRSGVWADPDGWNIDDEDIVVLMQTREMADAAIAKARKINSTT